MKALRYGLAIVILTAMVTPSLAIERSFDVCVDPATDVATQDDPTMPGAFLTAAANIFPNESFLWVG